MFIWNLCFDKVFTSKTSSIMRTALGTVKFLWFLINLDLIWDHDISGKIGITALCSSSNLNLFIMVSIWRLAIAVDSVQLNKLSHIYVYQKVNITSSTIINILFKASLGISHWSLYNVNLPMVIIIKYFFPKKKKLTDSAHETR